MIKLVIFDLDDTLISEKEYVKSGFKCVANEIEKKYQIKNSFEELITLFKKDSKMVFNRYFESHQIQYSTEDIQDLIRVYRTHHPTIQFYDDVLPTIQMLRKSQKKIAILSDGYIETQESKIEALNAKALFDEILLTDTLGKEFWKPNPKGFEILKNKFGVDYSEMVYVGDNPQKDFYITKYYPIHTIRIIRKDTVYQCEKYLGGIQEEERITNLMEGRYE